MGKRLICLVSVVVLLAPALADAASTGPVGWWKLNEKSGTTAGDSSKNKNHGALMGGAAWAVGQLGGAVQFDGTDDYVNLPIGALIGTLGSSTFTVWANYSQQGGAWQRLFDIGTGTAVNMFLTPAIGGNNTGDLRFAITTGGSGAESQLTAPDRLATGWHHVAVVIDADAMNMELYLDGAVVATATTDTLPQNLGNTTQNWLGRSEYAADAYYSGLLDDFRIYDRALTQEEVAVVMEGGLAGLEAAGPSPAKGATDVPREVILSWVPSDLSDTHDVYLGLSEEDVRSASRDDRRGVLVSRGQDANTYEPPERLELGQTYYWRVDEVNAPPSTAIFKGNIWSFTVEPYSYAITNIIATASSKHLASMGPEKTVDGSGLDPETDLHSNDATAMWLSKRNAPAPTWIQYEFDRAYKLDQMLVWNSNGPLESGFGLGAKDVNVAYSVDGNDWTPLGAFEFAPATGEAPCAADTVVDFDGRIARYVKLTINSNWGEILVQYGLSEVRFLSLPVWPREPEPADGTTDLHPQVSLSWRAGREAASHEVYLGTDPNALALADTVAVPEYETAAALATSYYWQVVEVNSAEVPPAWDGDVWSFATAQFIVVDDFESYTDDFEAYATIFDAWIDGWTDPQYGGSQSSHADPPYAEQTVVHSGRQSMPLAYDNTSGLFFSEVKRTFESAQDWSKHGITSLVLYFRGVSDNGPAPLYVKINDKKVVYSNGASATGYPLWKQWSIDLAASGAGLQSVKSLTIGLGSGTPGGKGILYVDDIRLYATAPAVVGASNPGTGALVAYYALDGNVQDSSGKNNHGTASGDAFYDAGVVGQALMFNGTNTYVDLPIGSTIAALSDMTISLYANFSNTGGGWQRIFDFGTGTTNYMFLTPRTGTTGPMRFAIRTATVTERQLTAPATLPSGWHHVAVVINSTTMRMDLYLDGEVVVSRATTLLPKDLGTTTQNWLGRSQFTGDAYYTGVLDEFRIFNRALSAGEVRYLAGDR